MAGWDTRRKVMVGTPVAVLVIGLVAWLLWPAPADPPARERQYKATTACLLADDKGLAGDPARSVWAGMQDASLATQIKVQYLTVSGPQTVANALTYFNTLGVQGCDMILAAGPVPVGALVDGHARFPEGTFVAVGGGADGAPVDVKGAPIKTVAASPASGVRKATAEIVATIG